MEYGLQKGTLDSGKFVRLTEKEFESIKSARQVLLDWIAVEEKFDLLFENYIEWETSLLQSAARFMVSGVPYYDPSDQERMTFNRRLMNFLSSARSYIDQSKRHVAKIAKHGNIENFRMDSLFSQEYDSRLGYRVSEELRNFVQHYGFPVHTVLFNTQRDDSEKEVYLKHSVHAILKPEELKNDGKFKTRVLQEIEEQEDQLNLTKIIRDYAEGLAHVHEETRKVLNRHVTNCLSKIDRAMERYWSAEPPEEKTYYVSLVAQDDREVISQKFYLLTRFQERIKYYRDRNQGLKHLTRKYISNIAG